MIRVRFYVGTHDKDNRELVEGDYESISNYLTLTFGGYTEYDTTGVWRDDSGNDIKEPSKVYEVITDNEDIHRYQNIKDIASTVKRLASQSAVLYTEEIVQAKFV